MLKYNGYTATLKIDVDSGLLLGQVVDVNDAITFQAKTIEEAIEEFHHAVNSYLRVCAQVGKEPDKPFSGKMPFRTKPEVHKAIFLAATQAGKSMNAWMEEMLYDAARHPSQATDETLASQGRSELSQPHELSLERGDRTPSSPTNLVADPFPPYPKAIRLNLSFSPENYQQVLANLWTWLDIRDDYQRLQFDEALQPFIRSMAVIQPFLPNHSSTEFYQLVDRIYRALDVESPGAVPPDESLPEHSNQEGVDVDKASLN